MICLALVASTAMPGVAYFIIGMQYAYYSRDINPDWESDAIFYLCMEFAWVFLVWVTIGTEKALFGHMGEKLTFELRVKLIEELLHK